jgi:hypothetical protein
VLQIEPRVSHMLTKHTVTVTELHSRPESDYFSRGEKEKEGRHSFTVCSTFPLF